MNSWEHTTWKDTLLGLFIVCGPIAAFFAIAHVGSDGTPAPATTTRPAAVVHHSPQPVYSQNPSGLTVCADGWVSHSVGRGTCSHHGGER